MELSRSTDLSPTDLSLISTEFNEVTNVLTAVLEEDFEGSGSGDSELELLDQVLANLTTTQPSNTVTVDFIETRAGNTSSIFEVSTKAQLATETTSAVSDSIETSSPSSDLFFNQTSLNPEDVTEDNTSAIIGGIVGGIVVLVFFVAVFLYCVYKIKQERAFVGKYAPDDVERTAGTSKDHLVNVMKPPPIERLI